MTVQARRYCVFDTAFGFAVIGWSDAAVTCLRLPAGGPSVAERALLGRHPEAERAEPPGHVEASIALARLYFEGAAIDFSAVPVDLGEQPQFSGRVYDYVRALRWGETTSYGAVAKALGAGPEAARDVGESMARNPVPLIIPCHRVLAAGGRIGGFSAPGGAVSKARMLALEGVNLGAPGARVNDQAAFSF